MVGSDANSSNKTKEGTYLVDLAYNKFTEKNILSHFNHFHHYIGITRKLETHKKEVTPEKNFIKILVSFTSVYIFSNYVKKFSRNELHKKGRLVPTGDNDPHLNRDWFRNSGMLGNFILQFIFDFIPRVAIKTWIINFIIYAAISVSGGVRDVLGSACSVVNIPPSITMFVNTLTMEMVHQKLPFKQSRRFFWSKCRDFFMASVGKHIMGSKLLEVTGVTNFLRMIGNKIVLYGSQLSLFFENKLANKIMLFGSHGFNAIYMFNAICTRLKDSVITLELSNDKFSTFLERLARSINKRIKKVHHFEELDPKTKERILGHVVLNIPHYDYSNNNNVGSETHIVLKNILSILPQNVYVHKIEYFGYESDVPIVMYQRDGATTHDAKRLTKYENRMIQYAKKHYDIYRYINRETFLRKYLFDFVSDAFRPSPMSPTDSSVYYLTFKNETDEDLKNYFNHEGSRFTVEEVKRTPNNEIRRNQHLGDLYYVKLHLTKKTQREIHKLIMDIPFGLTILSVRRHLHSGSHYKEECDDGYSIYPYFRGPFQKMFRNTQCQMPENALSPFDRFFMDVIKKRFMAIKNAMNSSREQFHKQSDKQSDKHATIARKANNTQKMQKDDILPQTDTMLLEVLSSQK